MEEMGRLICSVMNGLRLNILLTTVICIAETNCRQPVLPAGSVSGGGRQDRTTEGQRRWHSTAEGSRVWLHSISHARVEC